MKMNMSAEKVSRISYVLVGFFVFIFVYHIIRRNHFLFDLEIALSISQVLNEQTPLELLERGSKRGPTSTSR